jgi:NAD(P)H-flavin reductase
LEEAEPGTRILLRGPYGAPPPQFENETLVLVGGGTGTASLLEFAYANRASNDLHFLLGARSQTEFFDLELFRQLGTVHLSAHGSCLDRDPARIRPTRAHPGRHRVHDQLRRWDLRQVRLSVRQPELH